MGFCIFVIVGWDFDVWIGFGREGEGMWFLIKVVVKENNFGIGVIVLELLLLKEEKFKVFKVREWKELEKKEKRKGEKF